ncbi:uncharacterized protein E0L32_010756 [Thyridium curvatum]|uniref:Multidrug and toxic compound extrusion protein n=1 Tax=Thyridium curvatum TaxID=1093900 RepID=A0A507AM99_9PEZI|nr:uncharacterized protein E0L32_010756 [Thyridium curvatum]TPX07334.1 hypothetical protein E0L32_010756 [Thyridium curvatum]
MSEGRGQDIPAGPSSSRNRSLSRDFASSFVASFTDASPIVHEYIARDLADWSTDEDVDDEGSGDDDGSDDEHPGPKLYARPSGIAYGGSRPAMGRSQLEEPKLTRIEKQQSIDAERSLLRDNHILPPKHPAVERPSLFWQVYKRLFSTKVPQPSPDEEVPDVSIVPPTPSEETPLLQPANGEAEPDGHENLNEQWEAAVAAGQIRTTWQREAKTIAVYSRSLVVTFLLQYSVNIASIFAVGRIGKFELGAVSLATMSANITFYAPVQGLATSLDTLCAQAYGSGHKHLVGLQLQRMTCFLMLLVAPFAVLWWNAEGILAKMLPEARSAELAGLYLRVVIPGMPAYAIFECAKRFVQAQGLFQANTYVLLISAPINVLLNYLFVWHLGWGFVGAPIAVAITQNLMPFLLFLYVIFIDGYQCWGGFSRRMFHNWGPMIRLALPGMIMVVAEWLAFEVLTLASGQFGASALAAQSILVTITSTTYQIPFPMSIAASTRIANLIGAKLVDAAKTCARVAFVAGWLIGIFNLVVVATLRYKIPLLFTQDREVIELVARVMPLCAVMQVFDGLAAVSHGILRGVGRQEIGGYANLIVYYILAVPLSFATAFSLDWELYGLWFGVSIGLFLVALIEYGYLYRYDWELAVRDAEHRNANA